MLSRKQTKKKRLSNMINSFHQPDLKRIVFLDNRFYTLDEVHYYPGSSTVLDIYPKGFGFDQWLKDVGNNASEIVRKAADIGSLVHNVAERLNKGEEITWADPTGLAQYSQHEWSLILRFADFWTKCKPELLSNEESFCSPELGYGGTLDRVVKLNGKVWLIDIKTSNAIHKTHELQLASYAVLWNQFNPKTPIQETGILWLKPNTRTEKIKDDVFQGVSDAGSWQLVKSDRHYFDSYEIFKHVLAIWKEENPDYKPANKILPDRITL